MLLRTGGLDGAHDHREARIVERGARAAHARMHRGDGAGEVGVISSVTQAFCSTCTRLRLSTEGKLFTCLFAQHGHDLRALMRDGASDDELDRALGAVWLSRDDRYSEVRTANTARQPKIEMSYIGG